MLASTIRSLLASQAQRRPSAPAICATGQRTLDFATLLEEIDRAAVVLRGHGVGPGTRVGLVLPPGASTAVAILAVSATATCVPLNPDYRSFELATLFRRLRIQVVLTTKDHREAIAACNAHGLGWFDVRQTPADAPAGTFHLHPPAERAALTAHPERAEHALVLHTSGSTALPKIVPLTHTNLLVSAQNVARSLALTAADRCLSALPQYHVGALVDLLLAPLSVGGSVAIASGNSASQFFECVSELQPTWYQAVPTMLQDLLHRARVDRRDPTRLGLRFVRSVSAPLPPAVLADFERAFQVPVVEIYGMTETAGVITSNPLPPAARRAGSVGVPAGPELRIVDPAGTDVATGKEGEILVRGPNVMSGYESEDATAASLDLDDWLRTGDLGRFDDDGFLYLTGRCKDIINRGGEKIAPREIDELALTHPAVRDAAAFGFAHATLGEEIALAVVCDDTHSVTEAALIAFLAERLAPFKVPRRIEFMAGLPRTPGGKLQRSRLTLTVGVPPDERARVPPATPTERLLASTWERALGVTGIGVHDDFFDLGGDSLKAATFLEDLRSRIDRAVPAAALYDHPTIAELASQIDAMANEPTPTRRRRASHEHAIVDAMWVELRGFLSTWKGQRPYDESVLVGANVTGGRPPFFWCVQGYSEYSFLASMLDAEQPIYGMRSMYGMHHRSASLTRLLVLRYADEIEQVQPVGPIGLGGFCAGAGLALDIARVLIARGRQIATACLVEYFHPLPYDGRLALFYCRKSAFQDYAQPTSRWRDYYTGDVHLHPTDAHHHDCLGHAELHRFVPRLAAELAAAHLAASAAEGRVAEPLPVNAYDARIQARVPRLVVRSRPFTVPVVIRNASAIAWPASSTMGVALGGGLWPLGARFGAAHGAVSTTWMLKTPLRPGETASAELTFMAPPQPGACTLSIDMLDLFGGMRWFADRGSRAFRRTLLVTPRPTLAGILRYTRGLPG